MLEIKNDNKKFNFRVAAIIFDNNKILLHKKKRYDFWILPGGRLEMGEDTKDGVKRELQEELGINENLELKYIVEAFFYLEEIIYHELCFYYLTNINSIKNNINHTEEFYGLDDKNDIFKWIPLNDIDKYNLKPKFLKYKLKNIDNRLEHIVIDDR